MQIDGPSIDTKGDLHHCYPLFKTLTYCFNSRFFPKLECAKEMSDLDECHTGSKRKQAVLMLNQQIYAKKVLWIPTYDPKTDSFAT